jgi:hypothetical protein
VIALVAALLLQAAPAPDAARLTAARAVIEQFLPAAQRDKMVDAMMAPVQANVSEAMLSAPEMKALFDKDPAFKAKFESFIAGEHKRSTDLLRANMPALADAMAKAYARRFTEPQLKEIGAFFATPTGREYVAQSMTLMSDPDVQAAQRTMMVQAMSGMQSRIAEFASEAARSAAAKE